jgi:hypothetical protein
MMATRLANATYWREDLCHSYWLDEGSWLKLFVATSGLSLLGSLTCAPHLPTNVTWICLRGLNRTLSRGTGLLKRRGLRSPPLQRALDCSTKQQVQLQIYPRDQHSRASHVIGVNSVLLGSSSFLSAMARLCEMSLTSQRAPSRFGLAILHRLWYSLLRCGRWVCRPREICRRIAHVYTSFGRHSDWNAASSMT